mgnify:CR=1 FL=1
MEIIIKGEAKEIAALLSELEMRRSVPFVGEIEYCSLDKQNAQLKDDSVKEAL